MELAELDLNFAPAGAEEAADIEARLWRHLGLDAVAERMTQGGFPAGDPIFMGTGSTHNACYMCSNSATTHGCGTCST